MAETWDNPAGTDGFEFVEYAAPDPRAMGELFERLGFRAIARHRHKDVVLYRQGGVNFIVNAEPDSFAQRFRKPTGEYQKPPMAKVSNAMTKGFASSMRARRSSHECARHGRMFPTSTHSVQRGAVAARAALGEELLHDGVGVALRDGPHE